MKNISIGDVVKVVKSNKPSNWYTGYIGETFEVIGFDKVSQWGSIVYVLREGFNCPSVISVEDVMLVSLANTEKENVTSNETPSQLNVNEAVLLLQSLLDFGYDPDVEIVLKHDSVRVNAFGKSFLVGEDCSLENICKSVVLLSGAEL